MTSSTAIYLSEFYEDDVKALVGRSQGTELKEMIEKKYCALDVLETEYDVISFIVSPEIKSMNGTFFLAWLGVRVQALGKARFINKYEFQCRESIYQNIHVKFIDRALMKATQKEILGVPT